MEPYTVAGMARQDCSAEGSEGRGDGASGGSPRKKVTISENYELVGVVVHSGQAHAGHYYSFIKDRRLVAPHRVDSAASLTQAGISWGVLGDLRADMWPSALARFHAAILGTA